MATVDILKAHGISYNAADLITASSRTRVPLWIAAAFCQKETGGANVFGHDAGGALAGGGTVTKAKFDQFMKLINSGHTSNGVGPFQITYKAFFPQAAAQGLHLWVPVDNMVFGLQLIKSYLGGSTSDAAIHNAGTRFNGASVYGDSVVQIAHTWHNLLGNAGSNTGTGTGGATTGYVAGQKVVKALQKHFGTTQDGVISSQDVGRRSNFPADRWTTIQWLSAGSAKGSKLVVAMQKSFKITADGKLGPATAKKLQAWAGVTQDGVCGTKTIGGICKKLGVK